LKYALLEENDFLRLREGVSFPVLQWALPVASHPEFREFLKEEDVRSQKLV
jgi:hypothetical protein